MASSKFFIALCLLAFIGTMEAFQVPMSMQNRLSAFSTNSLKATPISTSLSTPSLLTPSQLSFNSKKTALYMSSSESTASTETSNESKSVSAPATPSATKSMKKIIPLGLMLFFILFNYTILRDTKDVLVVTAPGSGAEIIPFLKTYVNLPSAIIFTIFYSYLTSAGSNGKPAMKQDQVFYLIMSSFLAFFGGFAWWIYPNKDLLHPNKLVTFLSSTFMNISPVLASVFNPILNIFRLWTYALFYTLANLWGSVMISLLFWGFANDITTIDEAKKYYPLFGLMANVALIFSGQYVKFVSQLQGASTGGDPWGRSLKLLMGAVVGCGSLVMALMAYMQKFVLTDPACVKPQGQAGPGKKKNKVKMSMTESFKFLLSSPYIRNLALLVISYGMAINIVEVTWKSKLKLAFPNPNEYSQFMGNFSSATGVITLLMMFMGRFIFNKFGWGVAAQITPVALLSSGLLFFALLMFPGFFAPLTNQFNVTPLLLAVYIGAAQNIISKGSKYSLFDPCKEMAYIPLDPESKTKGKAAVDVVGNPLGKSGGSFVQQLCIAAFGSLQASTPFLGGVLGSIILVWINAARSLNVMFSEKMKKLEEEEKANA